MKFQPRLGLCWQVKVGERMGHPPSRRFSDFTTSAPEESIRQAMMKPSAVEDRVNSLQYFYFRCLLTALVIWNIFIFFAPKMGCNFSSAMISRLLFGFCNLCFLMCAHTFLVTSVRGSGSGPTIFANASEGCM